MMNVHTWWMSAGPALLILSALANLSQAEVLTIYSDAGFPSAAGVFAGGTGAVFDGSYAGIVPPEGSNSWQTIQPTGVGAFWGYSYGASVQNLSRFNNGELRFWVRSGRGDIRVEIKNSVAAVLVNTFSELGWTAAHANQWVLLRVPLVGVNLTAVQVPVVFAFDVGPATFHVDNVRYVDTTTLPVFKADLRNIADHSPASQISWNALSLPAGWVRADQYIRLETDVGTETWGVQIYTDNTAGGADPRFTGDPSRTDPAGLVDMSITTRPLPLAWSIQSGISTVPTVGNPDSNFAWLYVRDQRSADFLNGTSYAIVKNNQGIQFSPGQFGSVQVPPNAIYFEANFSGAVTPRTYRTSALRLELFRD